MSPFIWTFKVGNDTWACESEDIAFRLSRAIKATATGQPVSEPRAETVIDEEEAERIAEDWGAYLDPAEERYRIVCEGHKAFNFTDREQAVYVGWMMDQDGKDILISKWNGLRWFDITKDVLT